MIVTVFRSRVRGFADLDRLEAAGERMAELAQSMPGFISYKDFSAPDGENVTVVEFDTLEHQVAWRDHPEHREVQRAARAEFFEGYRISVCQMLREALFPPGERGT